MTYGYNQYGSSGSSSGRGLRLIIGLVIAVIGIISYYSRTDTNPVTGEKQRIAMTQEQEMALGLQSAPQMAAQMGGAIDPARDPHAAKVAQIGKRLVERTEASRSPYANNFHFYLLNDPQTVNAFALPGGQIFITKALYERLQNEAQLAGVLGHEIGHVINRHSAEHMATSQLGQSLVTAVGVGASDGNGHGYTAIMIANAVNQMTQLKYSRSDESEADSYGLKYMTQAGFDPHSMVDVMQILKAASGDGGGPSWTQTHPNPDERIARITEWLKENYPKGIPSDLSTGGGL